MKLLHPASLLAAALLCSCLDFDTRLANCRDGGVWICGAPDAGAIDGGGGGTFDGPAGLVCNRDWCWDHPRPTGITLTAVWGTSASDIWVAGDLGTVAHFDGSTWTSQVRDPLLNVKSICGHGSDVYFGGEVYQGTIDRLHKWNGSWSTVDGTRENIFQLQCGTSNLWMAQPFGVSAMPWGAASPSVRYHSGGGEFCAAVAETGPEACVMACGSGGVVAPPYAHIRTCDGGLEYELVDTDGGLGDTFHPLTLWTDPNLGVLAGISSTSGQIWQRDASWGALWTGVGPGDIYAGAAYDGGSIAVGGFGRVVEVGASGVTSAMNIQTSGNSYLYGVWAPPSGDAWVVGERGCILQRQGATWVPRSGCAVGFEDVASVPQLFGVTIDGLWGRTDAGWTKVKSLPPGQVALWERPDGGGFAHLTADSLSSNAARLPLTLSGATGMYVASDQRVVIRTAGKQLIDTNLIDGARITFDAGVSLSTLTGNAQDGTVWAAGERGTVLRSETPGSWIAESSGVTTDIGDLSVGFGRVWVLSGDTLATRTSSGAWSSTVLNEGAFTRVLALDADSALLMRGIEAAVRINASFLTTPLSPPPTDLTGALFLRGDEVWGVGFYGGVVRFRVPR